MNYTEIVSKANVYPHTQVWLSYLEGVLHEMGDVIHAGVSLPPRLCVVLKIRHSVKIPLQCPEIFLKMLGELKRIKANQTL